MSNYGDDKTLFLPQTQLISDKNERNKAANAIHWLTDNNTLCNQYLLHAKYPL